MRVVGNFGQIKGSSTVEMNELAIPIEQIPAENKSSKIENLRQLTDNRVAKPKSQPTSSSQVPKRKKKPQDRSSSEIDEDSNVLCDFKLRDHL